MVRKVAGKGLVVALEGVIQKICVFLECLQVFATRGQDIAYGVKINNLLYSEDTVCSLLCFIDS